MAFLHASGRASRAEPRASRGSVWLGKETVGLGSPALRTRLQLEGTDVDDAAAVAVAVPGAEAAALVGEWSLEVVAGVDGLAAGPQGVGERRAAVVGQRPQPGVERVAPR